MLFKLIQVILLEKVYAKLRFGPGKKLAGVHVTQTHNDTHPVTHLCAYIHVYTHIPMHTYTHFLSSIQIHTYSKVCMAIYSFSPISKRSSNGMRMHVCVCVYVCVCMSVCVCECLCVGACMRKE